MSDGRVRLGWIAGLAACLALPACQEVGNPYYGSGPALYDGGAIVVQEPGYGYGRPYPGPGYGRGYDRGFDRRYDRGRDFDRNRDFDRQQRRVEQDRREFRQERREERQEFRRDNAAQDALRAVQQRDNNAQQQFYRSQGIR